MKANHSTNSKRPAHVRRSVIAQSAAGAFAALLLFASTVAPVFASETAGDPYPEKEHADVDYKDMSYVGVDKSKTTALLQELSDLTNGKTKADDPEKRTVELYQEINAAYVEAYTQMNLGEVKHYIDANDEALAEKSVQDAVLEQELKDEIFLGLREALEGEYADDLQDQFTAEQREMLLDYEALTDREKELLEEEKNLEKEYDRLSVAEYTYEYNGETWTMDRLYEEELDDYDALVEIYLGISKLQNEACAPVYQQMVKVRKEIAELAGYDNYIDYAYDVIYDRDFTGDDIAALRETILEKIKPVYDDLHYYWYFTGYDTTLPEIPSGDAIVEELAPRIEAVAPELMEAYRYMQEHGLYHIGNEAAMIEAGFTTDLPQYGAEFIYNKTSGTLHDYETIVHEFGHYNAGHHAIQDPLFDPFLVDVAEIQSQGLEMLFIDQMKEVLPDKAEGLEVYLLLNILDSVMSGFEYDEFQQEVFSREDMTVEELNRLAYEIDQKYTAYFYDEDGEAYEWVGINHTFSAPFYYIGYATSGLSALDIWQKSKEDRAAAIDHYLQITAVPLDMPYQEATVNSGLRNMLKAENISALGSEIGAWASKEGYSTGDGSDLFQDDSNFPYADSSEGITDDEIPPLPSDIQEMIEDSTTPDTPPQQLSEEEQAIVNGFLRFGTGSMIFSGVLGIGRLIALVIGIVAYFKKRG